MILLSLYEWYGAPVIPHFILKDDFPETVKPAIYMSPLQICLLTTYNSGVCHIPDFFQATELTKKYPTRTGTLITNVHLQNCSPIFTVKKMQKTGQAGFLNSFDKFCWLDLPRKIYCHTFGLIYFRHGFAANKMRRILVVWTAS